MHIGIMGGTFDPIHTGHLIAAETAREAARLDEVWFMPASAPPHKDRPPGATAEERLEMVQLAVHAHPCFRAIDIELQRGGVSYSVDTVEELRRRYPGYHFSYIIGADMVQYLPHWHQIERLCGMIRFIGLNRPGTTLNLGVLAEYIRQSVTLVEMPEIGISSTDIRLRRASGRSIRYLVPDPVHQYIEGKRLYES